MIKKLIPCILGIMLFALISCDNTLIDNSQKKLSVEEIRENMLLLQRNYNEDQVHKLLGKPNEVTGSGIQTDVYYLNNNDILRISYFSDGILAYISNPDKEEMEIIIGTEEK